MKKMKNRFIIPVFIVILAVSSILFSQSKGVVLIEDKLGPDVEIGKQYLVLIAIDGYEKWIPLKNPVRDAKELKEILHSRYYIDTVYPLYNEDATRSSIVKLFRRLQQELKPEDSVIISYFGHGYLDKSSGTGYWIPVDGGTDKDIMDKWIPNSLIGGLIGNIKSRHILLISDSCFSGQLLELQRGGLPSVIDNEYFKRAYLYRSRQVLTSGALETVPDESEFTRQLILLLKENNDVYLDPLRLYDNIRRGMKKTLPLFGELSGTGHQKGGSFLLFLKQAPGSPEISPLDFKNLELELKWSKWQSQFQSAVEQLEKLEDESGISRNSKKAAWEKLLIHYTQNNPFSDKDEQLRDYAKERIQYWENEAKKPQTNDMSSVDYPADVYIKTKIHSDGYRMMGKTFPARDIFYEVWISGNKYAIKMNYGGIDLIIIRSDKNIGYLINHKYKNFVASTLPLDMKKVIGSLLTKTKASLKVSPNGLTKKIGNWNCQGYQSVMSSSTEGILGESKSTIWATTDVPFDWKSYNEKCMPYINPVLAISEFTPFTQELIKEIQKIKGYAVASETTHIIKQKKNVTETKMSSTVIEMVKKSAPPSIYEIPAGYTKKKKVPLKWW